MCAQGTGTSLRSPQKQCLGFSLGTRLHILHMAFHTSLGGPGDGQGLWGSGSRSVAGPVLLQRSRGRSRSLLCQHQSRAQHHRNRDVCVGPPRAEELKDCLKHRARFTFPRAALIFPALSGEWGEPCEDHCPSPRHAELPLQNRSGTKFQELLKGTTFISAQRGPFGLSPTRNTATRILPSHN